MQCVIVPPRPRTALTTVPNITALTLEHTSEEVSSRTPSLYPAETGNEGKVTSYIPLRMAVISSTRCYTCFQLNGPSLVAFNPGYGLVVDMNIICQPPGVQRGNNGAAWGTRTRAAVGVNTDSVCGVPRNGRTYNLSSCLFGNCG